MKYFFKVICTFLTTSIGLFFVATITTGTLHADEMQKVIILPFKNIDKNPDYEYLEATITDSIREILKLKFAFNETPERDWKAVSKKNFLYDNECYTATYGISLGLYANQDVVINGGFTVKQGEKDQDAVNTTVRIISIFEKKIISEFVIDIPANNQIFKTIEKVADQAAREASKVLPNKDDWEKNSKKKTVSKKFLSNIALGIRGGGSMYFDGWANQFTPKLPALSFLLRANMPVISEKFFLAASFTYYQHEFAKDSSNYLAANGMSLLGTNNVVGGSFGYDFRLSDYFMLSPKLGGGAIFQTTQISGALSQTVNNTIPYAGAGLDFMWLATDSMSVVLDLTFNAQIEANATSEKTVFTFFPIAQLGINIGF